MTTKQEFTTAQLIGRYIELRDKVAVIKKRAEEEIKPLQDFMDVIASKMLSDLNDSGETSKKTEAGTAFKKQSTFIGVADWDEVMKYIIDNQQWQMLNRAVNKSAVMEYMKEHEDQVPPGVNLTQRFEVQFRKPTK